MPKITGIYVNTLFKISKLNINSKLLYHFSRANKNPRAVNGAGVFLK